MATTVTVLGAFTLVFTVMNAILIVFLIHLSFRKKQVRKLVTWIWKHGGDTSLGAARAHFANSGGGMGISHEDVLRILEDATVDDGNWDQDESLLTDNPADNERNLGYVLDRKLASRDFAVKNRKLREMYRRRNAVRNAIQVCRERADGTFQCERVSQ